MRTPGGDVVGTADFDDDYLCAGGFGLGLQLRGDDDANLNLELMHHTIFTDDGDGHFLTHHARWQLRIPALRHGIGRGPPPHQAPAHLDQLFDSSPL